MQEAQLNRLFDNPVMDVPEMQDGLKIRDDSLKRVHLLREVPTSGLFMTISALENFGYQILMCLKISWLQKIVCQGKEYRSKILPTVGSIFDESQEQI